MKKIVFALFAICILFSCGEPKKETKKEDLPEALGEEKSLSISKRSPEDLLENLYTELVNKDSALKNLDNNIREIEDSKSDSLKKFDIYNGKNTDYFASANYHVKEIKDSLLRKTLTNIIAKKLEAYQSNISSHQQLVNSINNKITSLHDLELALKISKTLPIIEKYQTEKLPNKKSILNLSQKIDQNIKLADMLYKK